MLCRCVGRASSPCYRRYVRVLEDCILPLFGLCAERGRQGAPMLLFGWVRYLRLANGGKAAPVFFIIF